MDHLKDKTVLLADWGLFTELAPRLARGFGRVLYHLPWASAYPKSAAASVGLGFEGVERVLTFWDHVHEADLVVFPDLYMADWQEAVKERFGKPVWGHGRAEALELDRKGTRRLQRDLQIRSPKTKVLHGLDALEAYLKDHDDLWVKISCFKGDGETWRHQSWAASRVYLDHLRARLGALAAGYEFLVEAHVEGAEAGFGGWTVGGEYPEASYWGFEIKDKAYVGKFDAYEDLPGCVREVNEKVAPVLEEERAVGFCSFEFRQGSTGGPCLIDPCMRCGSPPFEVMQEAYDNLPEIIWEGAHGRMVEPRPLGRYAAMAMIHCPFALTGWVPVDCPKEDRRWLKLRNAAVIDGELYHVPTGGEMPEIGAVCAVADTLEKAATLVVERSERVKGYNLTIHADALDLALEEIEVAREYGIEF